MIDSLIHVIPGISPVALYLELFSYTVMMSYNYCNGYSMMSYLEYPILLLQDFVLVFLVLKYKRLLGKDAYLIALGYFAVTALVLTKIMPVFLLSLLVVSGGGLRKQIQSTNIHKISIFHTQSRSARRSELLRR